MKKHLFFTATCLWASVIVMCQTDTTSRPPASSKNPKPFKEIITARAITEQGLFKVHKVDEKWYFEIPDSLLGRDILAVNRISKAAATYTRPVSGMLGYAGDKIGENLIRFSKGPNYKLFIQNISYLEISNDSSENGMRRSVVNSNFQPIKASFDIKAYGRDSNSVVIDVTDYVNGDNDVFFFDALLKQSFGLGPLQADKSYIDGISAYPENIEIVTLKTYGASESAKSYALNTSIILLPKTGMHARHYESRVGYFNTWFRDFDVNPQGVELTNIITRWRLEPKDEDVNKYMHGELVEPLKPIVFCIDPATPRKWVPYLIQGVNDWQYAFEKAGFKNAIYALEAPANDPAWSLEDARHSAIVYKASMVSNASGPHIHDPRTGEILEAHINWYHNVMQLIHDWYFIQAGAIDAKAQKVQFDDSLMGQLIRFVACHEVGHTLGLRHNFGASSTVPVDSLRSKRWVEAHGHTPSIMDYARFNYVAQPEDHITEKGIFPHIGAYDEWAIEWGYRWFPEFKSVKEEKQYFNNWITQKTAKAPNLWYGSEDLSEDPRAQSEDLGNDAVKAGAYGIRNLQRIIENVVAWTNAPGEDYDNLKRIQTGINNQFKRYIFHVTRIFGGIYFNEKNTDQPGAVFAFPEREQQRKALVFLDEQLFTMPAWLLNREVFSLTGVGSDNTLLVIQMQCLQQLLAQSTLQQFGFAEFYEPQRAYKVSSYLTDMQNLIWKELAGAKSIDRYRRNLQKLYVLQLISLLAKPELSGSNALAEYMAYQYNQRTDVGSLVKENLRQLLARIKKAIPLYKDVTTRSHLNDVRQQIEQVLKVEQKGNTDADKNKTGLVQPWQLWPGIPHKHAENNNPGLYPCDMWSRDSGDQP